MSQRRIIRQKCQDPYSISQKAVIDSLPEGGKQREFFENLGLEQWETVSFDPDSGDVCVKILNAKTGINMVVNISKSSY